MEAVTSQVSGRSAKRSSVACVRCRRYRTKCVRPTLTSVCDSCTKLALTSECRNPRRGEDQGHRAFRRRYPDEAEEGPPLGDGAASRRASDSTSPGNDVPSPAEVEAARRILAKVGAAEDTSSAAAPTREVLPPLEEVKEALHAFRNSYFQLGFLPLELFVAQLERDPNSVSLFLLLTILIVSARFTASLCRRFGSATAATDFYAKEARKMIGQEMLKPTLPGCQAFFLLSAHSWGFSNGDEESAMLMGVATRMAGLLCLHEESTYALPLDAAPGQIIHAEAARRTFWLIASQEDLTAGRRRHAPFALENIDVLLPCGEDTLAFGAPPQARASLRGTRPALADPATIDLPSRSLFATMLQSNHAFGEVARLACAAQKGEALPPWCAGSDFERLNGELVAWHENLPPLHRWSADNLVAMGLLGHDLAFFEITVLHHLSGVVLRKTYLGCAGDSSREEDARAEDLLDFWATFTLEMVQGALDLLGVFDEYAATRSLTLGMPPILIFGLYVSGTIFGYLCRWPDLCWELAPKARPSLERVLAILELLGDIWPMASCWRDDLLGLYTQSGDIVEGAVGFQLTAILDQMRSHFDGIYRHAPSEAIAAPITPSAWPSPRPSPSSSTYLGPTAATSPMALTNPRQPPSPSFAAVPPPSAAVAQSSSAIAEYDPRAASLGFPSLPNRLGAEFSTPLEDTYLAHYTGAGFALDLDLGLSWEWQPGGGVGV